MGGAMRINQVIEGVLAAEGGYVNDAADAGGETNFGITIATARANGYSGPMRNMTRDFAREVYMRQYVVAPGFDKVGALSEAIAAELVDTGVNMGPQVAGTFLQRALNSLNNQAKDYADLPLTGNVRDMTLAALKIYLTKRGSEGEKRLLALLNALQGERYVSLCEGRAANEKFMYGWLARIVA